MKNPTLLKANVNYEQALEIMDFLYSDYIVSCSRIAGILLWLDENGVVAKWTETYGNIMISEDFVKKVSESREHYIEMCK